VLQQWPDTLVLCVEHLIKVILLSTMTIEEQLPGFEQLAEQKERVNIPLQALVDILIKRAKKGFVGCPSQRIETKCPVLRLQNSVLGIKRHKAGWGNSVTRRSPLRPLVQDFVENLDQNSSLGLAEIRDGGSERFQEMPSEQVNNSLGRCLWS
jgi:hypothetical protein